MRKSLSVAFVPYWGAGNPYQDALAEHLSACGVQVRKLRSLKDMFRYAVLVDRTIDVVHLHWLPVFRWGGLSALRCLAFVMRLALLRMYGVRLFWTAHNLLPHESRHPKLDWLLNLHMVLSASVMLCICANRMEDLMHRRQLMRYEHLLDGAKHYTLTH